MYCFKIKLCQLIQIRNFKKEIQPWASIIGKAYYPLLRIIEILWTIWLVIPILLQRDLRLSNCIQEVIWQHLVDPQASGSLLHSYRKLPFFLHLYKNKTYLRLFKDKRGLYNIRKEWKKRFVIHRNQLKTMIKFNIKREIYYD